MRIWRTLLACSLVGLGGCAAPDVTRYAAERPSLDLVRYFTGTTDAWGMFQKRNGEVVKRFHVVIEGHEQAGALVLDEHFEYSDGTRQQRVWTLRPIGDGRWQGTAADVIGTASGSISGNALHWRYHLLLPVDAHSYDVSFDDWMYLVDDTTMVNRARMSKFGFTLGEVSLLFRRRN